jgi:hypothetical protein
VLTGTVCQGKEWEISQFGNEMVCKWSRILNAKMPRPEFFDMEREVAVEEVKRKVKGKQVACLHWSQKTEDGSVCSRPALACIPRSNLACACCGAVHALLRDRWYADPSLAGE